jgi:branched-chain amino acid transport system permease protein
VVGAALVLLLKNVASAYITRWMMLLGAVFVLIVMFVPEGLVPGSARLRSRIWDWLRRRLGLGKTSTKDTTPAKGEEST